MEDLVDFFEQKSLLSVNVDVVIKTTECIEHLSQENLLLNGIRTLFK